MKTRRLILMPLLGLAGFGQEQPPIQDLRLLLGKQVIVQRVPLCQPGTFNAVFTYAGKPATVVSLKAKKMQPLPQNVINRLPQGEARELLEGKGATILVKFEDGTQLDSCAAITPTKLPDYFELVPGQSLERAPVLSRILWPLLFPCLRSNARCQSSKQHPPMEGFAMCWQMG